MLDASENRNTTTTERDSQQSPLSRRHFVQFCALLALFYISSLLTTCSHSIDAWEQIQSTGKLRVVTRDNPSTYYTVDDEKQGFEYDLVTRFAEGLNLEVEVYIAPVNKIISDVQNGRAQIAAAGLTVTPAREQLVDFGPVYQEAEQVIVGRRIRGLPKETSVLPDFRIGVIAGSSHVDRLVQIKQSFPELEWMADSNADTMSLLRRVEEKELDLTIVDSNEYAVAQRYFPNLAKAFTISKPQKLAWAVHKDSPELLSEVDRFFKQYEETGELDSLKELNFGFVQAFDFVELVSFIKHSKERLPQYEPLFKLAARTYGLDWRFLAAMAYQESHWRPDAVSATGVKGMMMLTKQAAEDMRIADRKDPAQSIAGGTRYFLTVRDKIPERIQEPDRTWFALASYNVGFGHLEDARVLTQRAGKNPDLWRDVQEFLPLLEQKEYYTSVKYGKARGREPVKYVNNIRDFYDLLKWQERNQTETTTANDTETIEIEDNSERNILKEIFSPEIFQKN